MFSLAFAASFLPPVFISIFLNFLGYTRGKYLVLQPRFYRLPRVRHSVRSHIFSRSLFSLSILSTFSLLFAVFSSFYSLLWLYFFPILSLLFFFCSRSRDVSLTRESKGRYTREVLLPKFAQFAPGPCSQILNRLNIVSILRGGNSAPEDEVYP